MRFQLCRWKIFDGIGHAILCLYMSVRYELLRSCQDVMPCMACVGVRVLRRGRKGHFLDVCVCVCVCVCTYIHVCECTYIHIF
jgi:hypothetical protein